MAIIYRPLGKSYLDSSEWPALMRKFEDYVAVPYDDKSKKHIATIGIGVNLKVRGYLALVLKRNWCQVLNCEFKFFMIGEFYG